MARLIEADALKKAILAEPWKDQNNAVRLTVDYINIIIDEQPTVDAVPVVHGRWVTDEKGVTYCERCRIIDDYASVHNYCPNCGANMYLEVDNA